MGTKIKKVTITEEEYKLFSDLKDFIQAIIVMQESGFRNGIQSFYFNILPEARALWEKI